MLVIGLGGGVALEGVPESVDQVDVIELEPEVLNANLLLVDPSRERFRYRIPASISFSTTHAMRCD